MQINHSDSVLKLMLRPTLCMILHPHQAISREKADVHCTKVHKAGCCVESQVFRTGDTARLHQLKSRTPRTCRVCVMNSGRGFHFASPLLHLFYLSRETVHWQRYISANGPSAREGPLAGSLLMPSRTARTVSTSRSAPLNERPVRRPLRQPNIWKSDEARSGEFRGSGTGFIRFSSNN
jgi:hypothetical protein